MSCKLIHVRKWTRLFSVYILKQRESGHVKKNRPGSLGGVLCDNKKMFTDRLTHLRSPSKTMSRNAYNIFARSRLPIPKMYIFSFLFFLAPFANLIKSEPSHNKNKNKTTCESSKHPDQPRLIIVFALHMKKHWVLGYP